MTLTYRKFFKCIAEKPVINIFFCMVFNKNRTPYRILRQLHTLALRV